jgi:hypothetical protein
MTKGRRTDAMDTLIKGTRIRTLNRRLVTTACAIVLGAMALPALPAMAIDCQIGQPVVYGGCAFDLNGDGEFDWAVHDTDADGFYDTSSADLDFNGKPETFFTNIGSSDGAPYARYDHDTDGLYDDEELNVFGTNPYVWDTDGDGYSDGQEDFSGSSPMDPYCNPYGCG